MIPLSLRRLWLCAGYVWVTLVVYLSLTSAPLPMGYPGMKFGHLLAYAWLMLWFSQVYVSPKPRALAAVALCALGIVLECIQALIPFRHFSYMDMVIDAAGVLAASAVLRTRWVRAGMAGARRVLAQKWPPAANVRG